MPISADSTAALAKTYPMFYNDLKFIGNARLEAGLVQGIKDAVELGEQKFQQYFGGWYPPSNKFGINPLRPAHINRVGAGSNKWTWTCGASVSGGWSNADTLISSFNLDDNEIMLVYGYFNLSPVPNTVEIQIKPGNVTLPVMQLQPMRMKQEQYLFFPSPILIEPRSPFAVDASCAAVSTAEECGLLGYFFAPCSTLITR